MRAHKDRENKPPHRSAGWGALSDPVHTGEWGGPRANLLHGLCLLTFILLMLGFLPGVQLVEGVFDVHHDGLVVILQT